MGGALSGRHTIVGEVKIFSVLISTFDSNRNRMNAIHRQTFLITAFKVASFRPPFNHTSWKLRASWALITGLGDHNEVYYVDGSNIDSPKNDLMSDDNHEVACTDQNCTFVPDWNMLYIIDS